MLVNIKKILLEDDLTIIPPLKLDPKKLKIDTREKANTFSRRAANQASKNIASNIQGTLLKSTGIGGALGTAIGGGLAGATDASEIYDAASDLNETLPDDMQADLGSDPQTVGAVLGGISGAGLGVNVGTRMVPTLARAKIDEKAKNIMNRLDSHGVKPAGGFVGKAAAELVFNHNIAKRLKRKGWL